MFCRWPERTVYVCQQYDAKDVPDFRCDNEVFARVSLFSAAIFDEEQIDQYFQKIVKDRAWVACFKISLPKNVFKKSRCVISGDETIPSYEFQNPYEFYAADVIRLVRLKYHGQPEEKDQVFYNRHEHKPADFYKRLDDTVNMLLTDVRQLFKK